MRNLWKVGALSAVFGAVLGVGGCSDFQAAYEDCENEGRCGPQVDTDGGSEDGGSDAGDAGDGGDITPPPCGDGGVDYPDLTGFDNDCDGIDGVADAGFFVDPVGGKDDDFNGTREKPFKTLARALQEIRDGGTGRNIVYLGTGTYNEPAPAVDMPVSLYGGYTWRQNGNPFWDRFKDGGGSTFFASSPRGFLVQDVTTQDAGILLDAIHVASADGQDAGEPSIALRVRNVRELVLRDVVLEAGRGAPGPDGQRGSDGPDGGNGNAGSNSDSGVNLGGNGAQPQCSGGYAGGLGGLGGGNGTGNMGSSGRPATSGGAAGAAGTKDSCPNNICSCTGGDGGVGTSGNVGDAGTGGSPGEGSGRILAETLWEANQQGGEGKPGGPGQGGGGGGGGGNCGGLNDTNIKNPTGAAGGGGGSGGCGGTGGQGGGGGGASIGLLATNSQVIVDHKLKLIVRGGGQGGRGGAGGNGGQGGNGGRGGEQLLLTSTTTNSETGTTEVYIITSGSGGRGGNGGQGGNGGGGGGGGGGPSVGTWCVNTTITRQQSFDTELSPGGLGGLGSSDAGAATGLSTESIDCTFVDAGTP
ncbi:hypothetical protein [Corallococcus exercitus]|uniref:hypothetical protein n=1 Tax=Corallococcus exercitus TaxID=2316736 RepID=UPI0035D3F87C